MRELQKYRKWHQQTYSDLQIWKGYLEEQKTENVSLRRQLHVTDEAIRKYAGVETELKNAKGELDLQLRIVSQLKDQHVLKDLRINNLVAELEALNDKGDVEWFEKELEESEKQRKNLETNLEKLQDKHVKSMTEAQKLYREHQNLIAEYDKMRNYAEECLSKARETERVTANSLRALAQESRSVPRTTTTVAAQSSTGLSRVQEATPNAQQKAMFDNEPSSHPTVIAMYQRVIKLDDAIPWVLAKHLVYRYKDNVKRLYSDQPYLR